MKLKVGLIILLALVLRLIGLNQSFWQDEALTANLVRNNSYEYILKNFGPVDFHPPLYYFTLKTWGEIFGWTEISLRTPSVIFGVATVFIVYLLSGSLAALLTAVNPLLIYYSQESRMYSMATFFVILAVYFWNRKKFLATIVSSTLAVSTFYGTVFILPFLGMGGVIGILIGMTAVSGLIWQQWNYSKLALMEIKGWSAALGSVNLKNLALFPIKFSLGRISLYPKYLHYFLSILGSFLIIGGVLKGYKKNLKIFWMIVGTVSLGILFSLKTPLLQYFRFGFLVPLLMILISGTRFRIPLFCFMLFFSLIYILFPSFHREDWKSLSNNLKPNETIYMIPSAGDGILYYRPDIEIKDIRNVDQKEIKIVPFIAPIYLGDYRQFLENKGYSFQKEKSFRGVWWEEWVKK